MRRAGEVPGVPALDALADRDSRQFASSNGPGACGRNPLPAVRTGSVHCLKNGHPAHVFTDEDRRKAAAVTNQIRREKREIPELELLNEDLARRKATREARLARKREQARRRREARRQTEKFELWIERGYGARISPGEDRRRFFRRLWTTALRRARCARSDAGRRA